MLAKTVAVTLLAVLALVSAIACAGASASDAPPPMAADNAQVDRQAPAAPALVKQNNPPAPATAAYAAAGSQDTNPAILKDDASASSHGPIPEIKDPPPAGSFSAEAIERYVAELKAQDARFTPDTATPDQTAVINDAIGCLSTQAQGQLPDALIREVVWAEAAATASDANIVAHAINQCSLAQATAIVSADAPRADAAISHDATTANIITLDDALTQCAQGAASLPTATAAATRLCTTR